MTTAKKLVITGTIVTAFAAYANSSIIKDNTMLTSHAYYSFASDAGSAGFASGTPSVMVDHFVIEPAETIESRINDICADPENFEDGEPAPSPKAISEMTAIINEASVGRDFSLGTIGTYFGEASITWKANGKMLRLSTFSDNRAVRLDFGTLPTSALGSYDFINGANADALLEKLYWLNSKA